MTQDNDDTDLLPPVALGAALVATGTALSSVWPLPGLLVILGAVVLLVFAALRMVQRRKGRTDGPTQGGHGLWAMALVFGMVLTGGGAALSTLSQPMIGLGLALGGGVLCGVGGWRMIVGSGWRG